ncbi:actin-related protein t3 [Anaeramoeba flamelloides]|uniref:Actin-related protein t3 n=1 Tax=Anaeramoeba flamelloides TaxID=1746091 RepID=A0AAV7YMK0_9EUKA|nr:actin-related protein t3 [Anaeramoeba flamelloides]
MTKVVIDLGNYSFKYAIGTKEMIFEPQEIKCSEYGDPYNGKEITDPDQFKTMVVKIFEALELDPFKCYVLVGAHAHDPYQLDEAIADCFLNELNVRGLFIAVQPILSMYSRGKLDALVVEVGKNFVQIVPARRGWAVYNSIKVAKISENVEIEAITDLIQESLNSVKESFHDTLLQNIIVTGGNGTEELEEKLDKKLTQIYTNKKINLIRVVSSKTGRHNSALLGGCILSVQETFNTLWFNKIDYKKTGQEALSKVYTVPEEAKL